MNNSSPLVDLSSLEELGLIISRPSGVFYTNQTSGLACDHPKMEGFFVPLLKVKHSVLNVLERHFEGTWRALTINDANVLDEVLQLHDIEFIKVDRTKLDVSYEAWVHVCVYQNELLCLSSDVIFEDGETKGVLTWPNSD